MEHEFDRGGHTAVLMDPHPLCHSAVTALLAPFHTTIAGTATSVAAARALVAEHRPDLLITEIDLPEGSDEGLNLVSLAHDDPRLTVIVLSKNDDQDLTDAAFAAGAAAYITKTVEPDEIATAIRQALDPAVRLVRADRPEATITPFPPERIRPRLTRREVEILKLVAEGRSNRETGQVLWVTDQTVKFHLANIYRKLGVRNRYDASLWAHENGLLETAAPADVVTLEHDHRLRATGTVPARLTLHRATTRSAGAYRAVRGNIAMTPSEYSRFREPLHRTTTVYRPAGNATERLSRFLTAGVPTMTSPGALSESVQSLARAVDSCISNRPRPTRKVVVNPRRKLPVSNTTSLAYRCPGAGVRGGADGGGAGLPAAILRARSAPKRCRATRRRRARRCGRRRYRSPASPWP